MLPLAVHKGPLSGVRGLVGTELVDMKESDSMSGHSIGGPSTLAIDHRPNGGFGHPYHGMYYISYAPEV